MDKLCWFLVLALLGSEVVCQNKQNSTLVPKSTTMVNATTFIPTSTGTVEDCIRTCPGTSEYNPVCGSNGVTYANPGRLICAQACGVNVTLVRHFRCPPWIITPI